MFPHHKIPVKMPVHKFAFMIILPEPMQTGLGYGLDVMMLVCPVVAVPCAKESPITRHAAIRVLKHYMVKKPISKPGSFRTVKLFTAAIGTPGRLRVGSSFTHGGNPLPGIRTLDLSV